MKELNCDPDLYPGFAFNPDTILRIEILIQSGDASRHNDPINNHNGIQFLLNPDTNEQPHAILIETLSDIAGDEGAISTESNLSRDIPITWKIITLHINSCILAAKSRFFFRKLFPNGKSKSSIQRHITLRIHSSEEDALMELLNFMYSNTLAATSLPALLDVLMAAHKFEVASCMRYCNQLLRSMSMTLESALFYLEQVPSSVLMADELRPLTDAAKQYLCTRYKDITKFQEEGMGLPLVVLEVILSNDDLEVPSEDVVYNFVLKWACTHYPNLEERREVLGTRLAHLIRFPYMTCPKLKNVLTCNDFEHKAASKLVLEALFFKAEAPHRQRILAAQSVSLNRIFVKRSYKYQPVRKLTWIYIHKLLILGCRFDFIFFGLFFALFLWLSVVTLR